MEIKSLRFQDSIKEKAVADFLDEKLYSSDEFKVVSRVEDKESQLSGIDISVTHNSFGDLIIDEKAQIHYIDKSLPTFAFEIDFRRYNKELVQGWLFDEHKKTTHYLLVWINTKEGFLTKKEDIKEVECYLIKRKKIVKYLETQGINSESSKLLSALIRKNPGEKRYLKLNLVDCYFFFSEHLNEEPVNIVIRKSRLKMMCEKIFKLS